MDEIRLNFIVLSDQGRKIAVYRKLVLDSSIEKEADDYRTKLPPDHGEKWKLYDISRNPKEGYDFFECNYSTQPHYSEYYLFQELIDSLSDDWKGCDFELPENSKYKEVRFITNRFTKGCTEIIVHPYFLKSHGKIGFIFQHHFRLSSKKGVEFDREVQKLSLSLDSTGKQNVFYYRDKEALITNFVSNLFRSFVSGKILEIDNSFFGAPSKKLENKSYLVKNNQLSPSQFMGIKNKGPFRKINEKVRYLFVFSEKTRPLARDIYLGLSGKLFPAQFPGLPAMFDLEINNEIVEHHVVRQFDKDSLNVVGEKVKEIQRSYPDSKILILIALPKGIKGVEGVFDAYGYLKLLSLKNSAFCQFVTEDSFFRRDQIKWSISNIGLQIFCKLGGAPWLVKPAKNNCLILGLGSAHEKVNGQIKRYVAYTVCLDSSGDFKYIEPLAASYSENSYLESFRSNLAQILRAELNNNYNSFVLHLPFKIKYAEINSIKDVVNELRESEACEVFVLKINTNHRFLGFSAHNTRVPYESSILKLSSNQFLIWAEGLQYGKEVLHSRIAEPLLVDFLESPNNSWESKLPCLQDVLNLTGANWRGFNSKAQPISILYSKLIADFMKEFSHLEGCGDFSILRAESIAPWFL